MNWPRLALIALGICLVGCGDSRGDPPASPRQPGMHLLDQFSDIEFPPGWKQIPEENHVAIAIGGGTSRRLLVALQAPANRADIQPDQAMAHHVAGILPGTGWTRVGDGRPTDMIQRWTKGSETLEVRGSREGGLAVLRYRLIQPEIAR